jgi:CheY-like chemotaxis protein
MADESKLAGARVLVIEDDDLSALVAQEMLVELGCAVAGVATSVETAMAALQSGERLDCVMLDVRLGHELSSDIATHLIKTDTPFIICSGYDIKLPGMNIPVVDKPYTIDTLGKALNQALSRR